MRQTVAVDFVERRIQQAQRAGVFDDLELAGRPIPDLDTERPEGWWAEAFVARDRRRREAIEVVNDCKAQRTRAFSLADHPAVRSELRRLAERVAAVNAELDPAERVEWFDVDTDLATWRHRDRMRRWGVDLGRTD